MKKRLSATLTSPQWEDWLFAFHATCCLPLVIFLPTCPSRLSLIVSYRKKRIDLACKSLFKRWLQQSLPSSTVETVNKLKHYWVKRQTKVQAHPSDQPTNGSISTSWVQGQASNRPPAIHLSLPSVSQWAISQQMETHLKSYVQHLRFGLISTNHR